MIFPFIEVLNRWDNPPVRTILNDLLVCFLINLTILSIKPEYPQKKPDLTADIVLVPMTFEVLAIYGQ